MTPARRRAPTAATTEWLDLLAVEGPFLAAPVVKDIWPGGLPALNRDDVGALREASSVLDASPGTRDGFVRHVLTRFLGWGPNLVGAGHVPATLTTPVPEYGTDVRPDFVLLADPADPGTQPLLLGMVIDPGVRTTARPRPSSTTPDRCRRVRLPLSYSKRRRFGRESPPSCATMTRPGRWPAWNTLQSNGFRCTTRACCTSPSTGSPKRSSGSAIRSWTRQTR